jgi:hypothetical protein
MQGLIEAAQASRRPAPAPSRWSWQDAARATWSVYARAAATAEQPRMAGRRIRPRPAGAGGIEGLEPQ